MSATCTHEHSGNQTWRQLAPIENMGAICTHAPMSDEKQYPSQLADRFQIRMPEGLRDRIRSAAEANNRSMNAEIIARLEKSFAETVDHDGLIPTATSAKLTDTVSRLEAIIKYIIKSGGTSSADE